MPDTPNLTGANADTSTDSSKRPSARRSGAPGGKQTKAKSPRRRAREFALKGLYEWLVGRSEVAQIDAHMREQEGFAQADSAHFDALLNGCIEDAAALDALLARHVDRHTNNLSPVEHAILLIGAWELQNTLEVPYRVVINEGVELAKAFGGTDGHKYVNGVLDKLAGDLRAVEVGAARSARS